MDNRGETPTFWMIDSEGWQAIPQRPIAWSECEMPERQCDDVDNGEAGYPDEMAGMTLQEWNSWTDRLIEEGISLDD